ncbi:MAG: hypothetical protein ABIW76_14445 [Fibrobacteria bacterium]
MALYSFLVSYLAPVLGSTIAGVVVTWILGRLTDSAFGGALLAKSMRQSRRVGRTLSVLGNSKLGPLWNPLETFGTTWVRSNMDEFFVGLREDNPEKLGEELERLEAAGSVTRAKAIAEKIEALGRTPPTVQTAQDAAMFSHAYQAADRSIEALKKDG